MTDDYWTATDRIAELFNKCFRDRMATDEDYARKMRAAQDDLVKVYKDNGIDIRFEIEAYYDHDHISEFWQLNIEDSSGNELMVIISSNAEKAFRDAKIHCLLKYQGEDEILVEKADGCIVNENKMTFAE